jgi:putative hydrolase of the HAD superfamily
MVKKFEGIKAVLFDVDNTLVDFMTMKHRCCEAAIDAMIAAGLKVKREKALNVLFKLYDRYGIEYKEIFQKFLKQVKGKIDYRVLAHGIVAYRKVKEFYVTPYPNVVPTLIALKRKYRLAVISDAPRIHAWLRLVTMKIDPFFDIVITKGDVKRQKDSPIPFKAALKELNIRPEEAMMVGDRTDRDVAVAKKLGIKTCYARYGAKQNQWKLPAKGKSGADFEIENIRDLLKVL